MIDAPGRKEQRFPASKEALVRADIARQLNAWRVGSDDVAICGGARGADMLFAEECLKRGARTRLLIALPEAEFVERSVRLPAGDYEERYRALRKRCETQFQHEALGPAPEGVSVFARNNMWCMDVAKALVPPERVLALLVWDGLPTGDGPGGTSDFAARVAGVGGRVAIINPTKL
jgi:hypothetical protein